MRHKHTNNILIYKILYQSSPRNPGKATDQRIGLGEDLSKTKVRKGTSLTYRLIGVPYFFVSRLRSSLYAALVRVWA